MKIFSKTWKSSKKPRKQRKYRLNAPLHIRQNFANAHLSKELKEKYGKRSIAIRKGDKVKVIKGQFKKHEGRVERVDVKGVRIFVGGVEITKKDGTKKLLPIYPSNLMITEVNLDDKFRQKILEGKQNE